MPSLTLRTGNRVVARSIGTVTAAGILGLLAAMPAHAVVVDPFFTIHFVSNGDSSAADGGNGIPGIQAEANYSFSTTEIGKMILSLKNTSVSPITGSKLVGTGFDLPQNPSVVSIDEDSSSAIVNWAIATTGGEFPPFGTFDICVSTPNGDCLSSGGTEFGLVASSEFTPVATFFLKSVPQLNSALAYRDAFASLFTTAPDDSFFVRFKDVDFANFKGKSDKVIATSITRGGGVTPPPPPAPGDEVPGPLPLFGAAAAFGYSRKLRQRMKATTSID